MLKENTVALLCRLIKSNCFCWLARPVVASSYILTAVSFPKFGPYHRQSKHPFLILCVNILAFDKATRYH